MFETWRDDPELAGQRDRGRAEYGEAQLWVDDVDWHEAELPQRPWIAPGYALRGAVTVIAGPPSGMKSSLMLAWACAVALKRDHAQFNPTETGGGHRLQRGRRQGRATAPVVGRAPTV